jgi:hypothetical protein
MGGGRRELCCRSLFARVGINRKNLVFTWRPSLSLPQIPLAQDKLLLLDFMGGGHWSVSWAAMQKKQRNDNEEENQANNNNEEEGFVFFFWSLKSSSWFCSFGTVRSIRGFFKKFCSWIRNGQEVNIVDVGYFIVVIVNPFLHPTQKHL